MGFFKKIFKPVSKVLDKIVPNEVKPYLPYAAAFAPMFAPGMFGAGASGLGGLFSQNPIIQRAIMGGALNMGSQLAQEGNEGDLNWLSTGLGALTGAMTGKPDLYNTGAGSTASGANPMGYKDTMLGGFKNKGMEFLGKGSDIYQKGMNNMGLNMDTLKMAALPASTAIGDSMAFEANTAMKEYERALAEYNTEQGALGNDAGRREAILSAMRAYNHPEDLIESTLAELGLRDGGRVGLEFGGIPAAVQNIQNKTAEDDMKLAENMDIDWQTLAEEFEITFKRPHQNDKELFDFYRNKYGFNGDVSENVEVEETMTAAGGGIMGRKPFVSGGIGKGIMRMIKGGDDAVDLTKQKEVFRDGPITAKFMDTVDEGVINPAIRTRDMGGSGGYGMYKNFREMPAGLQAAELISRIRKPGGGIDYEAAEIFIGKKLRGNETIDELIAMIVKPQNIKAADGGIMNSPQTYHQYHDQTPPLNLEGLMGYNTGGSVLPQGMEMDYRGGGMIPEGSQERADDVPARVSKNEFVMTADAVRAAGGGNVNQGAKRMYNLMNNLEARA